jgi:energy-converting hydrogenase Eha subunit B
VLGGAEILLIPLSGLRFLLVQGIGAVGSLLCAAMLAGAGTYLCVRPERARTVGLVIITVGLASYLVANLGGFLLGMVLALISGSLAVAWRTVSAQ